MSVLIILSGLPGSGKSYTAQKARLNDSIFYYSTDDYIEQQAISNETTYTETFEHSIRDATQYMDYQLKQAIANNMSVIWDQHNTLAEKRKWIISKFPAHYVKTCFAIIPPRNDREWQMLEGRLLSRPGRSTPRYVMESMLENYQEPTLEEGFDLINIVSINGNILEQLKGSANI
jgi:predicted kinase